jgi:hypothetical protein
MYGLFYLRTVVTGMEHLKGEIGTILTNKTHNKANSVVLVRKRTIPTERPPHDGEVSANFCG